MLVLIYMSALPAGSPSATSGLRIWVKPLKPASPIGHLSEQYQEVLVFLLIRFSPARWRSG